MRACASTLIANGEGDLEAGAHAGSGDSSRCSLVARSTDLLWPSWTSGRYDETQASPVSLEVSETVDNRAVTMTGSDCGVVMPGTGGNRFSVFVEKAAG